jgi:hypothetical protein
LDFGRNERRNAVISLKLRRRRDVIAERRYDLDWLRVIAFAVLIYYHTAIFFIPGGLPMIQNGDTSPLLEILVQISSQFRLGLLFLISGVGVAFARRRRTTGSFVAERSRRLLVPLSVGILLVVPPMVYLEKVFLGEFAGNLWNFYPRFFTQGVYPQGNLSWHHFWFVAYLYLFCILGLRLFSQLDGSNDSVSRTINRYSKGFGLYAFIVPLFIAEVALRAFFPGFRDLIHDWASFTHWFLLFLAGFTIANHIAALDSAVALRRYSLFGAVLTTLLMFFFFGGTDFNVDRSDPYVIAKYVGYCGLRMSMAWCCLLSCLGFAGKYLRSGGPLLSYLNEAVYPLFILHLTIITALGFATVELQWGLWQKYFFITTGTIILVLASYHVLIRPFDVMRMLFGVKPRASQGWQPVSAACRYSRR